MSQAQTLLQKFLNKEMECCDFQKALFEYYKSTDRDDEIKKEILDIVEAVDKEKDVRKDMWGVFFLCASK